MKQKCLFVSFGILGFTALIFQVVFAKKLMLIFGLTAPAVATVLAVYFSGLAIGGLVFGRIVDKLAKKANLIYISIFVFTGVYGLLTPFLFSLLGKLIQAVNHIYPLNFSGFNFFAFLFSFLLLVLPAIFIGGAFPVVSKILIQDNILLGKKFSLLYAVDTFGSALGVFLAGFVFLPTLGNNATTVFASVINIFLAIYLFKFCKFQNAINFVIPSEAVADEGSLSADKPIIKNKIFIPVLFITGFLALALEVLYTKTLILFVGSSTYAFSLILLVFLLGMALGSLAVSFLVNKIKRMHAYFGMFVSVLAFWLFLTMKFFNDLPFWYLQIFKSFESFNFSAILTTQSLFVFLIVFPVAFFMGITFPLGVILAEPSVKKLGNGIGRLYFANTFGGVFGSVIIGFFVLPFLGYQKTFTIIILIYFFIGGLFILKEKTLDRFVRGGLTFFIILWATLTVFSTPWAKGLLTLGTFIYAPNYLNIDKAVIKKGIEMDRLLFYKEGLSNVAVIQRGPTRLLRVNGKTDASNNLEDLETEILIGALPMIYHPNPKEALLVGLGSGITLGSVTRFDEAEKIDVVEIDPAVVQAAQYFTKDNNDALSDSRVNVITADGRNYLSLNDKKYDVISSEPSNIWVSGNLYLFTKEYYELLRAHLKDGGLVAQWVHAYALGSDDLKSVLKTFQEVFPNIYLFDAVNSGDLILIGALDKNPVVNFDLLKERFGQEKIKNEFSRIHISDPYELATYFVAGGRQLSKFSAGAEVHTDNRTFLEFSAPKKLFQNTVPAMIQNINKLRADTNFRDYIIGGKDETLQKYFIFRKDLAAIQTMLNIGDLEGAIDSYNLIKRDDLRQSTIEADILRRCNLTAQIAQQENGVEGAQKIWDKCSTVFNEVVIGEKIKK